MLCLGPKKSLTSPRLKLMAQGIAYQCSKVECEDHSAIQAPQGQIKGFKKLPKVQKIAKSGHTALREHLLGDDLLLSFVEWKPFYICKFYLTALVTLSSIVTTYYPFI